jgi:hypothetical protein
LSEGCAGAQVGHPASEDDPKYEVDIITPDQRVDPVPSREDVISCIANDSVVATGSGQQVGVVLAPAP